MKHATQKKVNKVKLLALFVLSIITFNVDAHSQSSFRLLLPVSSQHLVVFDNMTFNGVGDRFKINDLNPGNHRLKVIQFQYSRRGYLVNKMVLYNGFVFVPKNSRVWAQVNNYGRFFIDKTLCYDNNSNRHQGQNNRSGNRNYQDGGYNSDRDRLNDDYYDSDYYGYDDRNGNDYSRDNRNNSGRNEDYSYSGNNRNGDNTGKNHEQTFQLSLRAIEKQSFDTDRLKMAKNLVNQGGMQSSEIATIAKLFSFESTKVEFAKYAYPYTNDKRNYVLVQDSFQFSSSISELQDFIAQYQGH